MLQKRQVLRDPFFNRSTVLVARELIGKFLVRRWRGRERTYLITETEAYNGFLDRASHAHRGKTARNEVMFREAGHIYVYFTYGMHWMLNIVTGPREYPAAVLIRGVEGITGPARVTKALHIDRSLNKKPLGKAAGLWIEDRGIKVAARSILRTPRIGIRYAGKTWEQKLYRFVLKRTEKRTEKSL